MISGRLGREPAGLEDAEQGAGPSDETEGTAEPYREGSEVRLRGRAQLWASHRAIMGFSVSFVQPARLWPENPLEGVRVDEKSSEEVLPVCC